MAGRCLVTLAATLFALVVMIAVCACASLPADGPGAHEGYRSAHRGNRLWPTANTGYYWNREMGPRPGCPYGLCQLPLADAREA